MDDAIKMIGGRFGLTTTLATHLYRLLTEEYTALPRMEAYRLRRSLKSSKIKILVAYGKGYFLMPDQKKELKKTLTV